MTEEQKILLQIGKKENVVRLNSNKEPYEILNMSKEKYLALPIEDRYSKVDKLCKDNNWKGKRQTAEQKEKEKEEININNAFDVLKDILKNGTKEEKGILLGVIEDHKRVLEIEQLEREVAEHQQKIKDKEAKIKELKGE